MVFPYSGMSFSLKQPVSPALAGGFSTTAPPGKPNVNVFNATLSCTFKNGKNGKFHVMYIFPQ